VLSLTPDPENLNPISQTSWEQINLIKWSAFWLSGLENCIVVYEIILDSIKKFVLD
jgi:hypothetical protein